MFLLLYLSDKTKKQRRNNNANLWRYNTKARICVNRAFGKNKPAFSCTISINFLGVLYYNFGVLFYDFSDLLHNTISHAPYRIEKMLWQEKSFLYLKNRKVLLSIKDIIFSIAKIVPIDCYKRFWQLNFFLNPWFSTVKTTFLFCAKQKNTSFDYWHEVQYVLWEKQKLYKV